MKNESLVKIGGILFLIGFVLIIVSWYNTYPIHLSSINELTFSQFYVLYWPGLALSFIGIFFVGFYCKNKIVVAVCSSVFPVLLYSYRLFFTIIACPDAGTSRGMFQVFHLTGIDFHIIPYFSFPSYFSLNEILYQVAGLDGNTVGLVSFMLYGFLLGLFLYLFFNNLKRQYYDSLIPFLLVIIYSIGMFSFLNYQWVPQTLSLVYFFLLIMISSFLLFDEKKNKWNFFLILVFIPLVLSHAFIPVIFLSFFGILVLKKRYLFTIFLVAVSIYVVVTIYYSTVYLPLYIQTFQQSISGFSSEYSDTLSKAFTEPEDAFSQLISFFNKLTVPMIWIIGGIGTIVLFFKKRIDYALIATGIAGGMYLSVGLFFSVLGVRAAQLLFIVISVGFMFFISKWKKLTMICIFIILILAIFGPMRMAYNNTHFQIDEEAETCNFLADKIINATKPKIAIGQINFGYFTSIYSYLIDQYFPIEFAPRPGDRGFLDIFNATIQNDEYIIYDSNMGKEILRFEMTKEQLINTLQGVKYNSDRIYDSGSTFILNGIH